MNIYIDEVDEKKNSLPLDTKKYSYRFYKNLNEDVKLKSDEMGRWDIDFDFQNDDWYNVDGFDSLFNACVIAVMTRFQELNFMELYTDFGCRVHELIKANKTRNQIYYMELFITDVLNDMRRVKKVNWVEVVDSPNKETYNYQVTFNVSCMIDEDYSEEDVTTTIIEESFLV